MIAVPGPRLKRKAGHEQDIEPMAVTRGRRIAIAIAAVLALLFALFWFLPARWVLPLLERKLGGVHATAVEGSLWNGSAGAVLDAHGKSLGHVDWTLARTAVWGHLQLAFDFGGPIGSAGAQIDGRDGASTWRNVRLDLAVDQLSVGPALREQAPSGRLTGTFDRIQMQDNWPLALAGTLRWRHAALSAQGTPVELGDFRVDLNGTAGVVSGIISDEGDGPLQARGSLLAAPLGWRLTLDLTPRQADPALRRVLTRWAAPAADGSFHIAQRVGLAPAQTP
jgi:general secretion pathway protein N